ncbi:hypothetical protein [Streptomyces narbonensis]|uniref:hypothetical protein n=1 Tax=Streptomyces narbonensis TaxID=67333 RepID=UPI0033F58CE8
MIRKPAGVPDGHDPEGDRAARRLEEFLRARGLGDEETDDEDDEVAPSDDGAPKDETDDSEAGPDPDARPEPPEDHQAKP